MNVMRPNNAFSEIKPHTLTNTRHIELVFVVLHKFVIWVLNIINPMQVNLENELWPH